MHEKEITALATDVGRAISSVFDDYLAERIDAKVFGSELLQNIEHFVDSLAEMHDIDPEHLIRMVARQMGKG